MIYQKVDCGFIWSFQPNDKVQKQMNTKVQNYESTKVKREKYKKYKKMQNCKKC